MSSSNQRFAVRLAGQTRADYERLALRAEQRRLQALLHEVLLRIHESLESRPREWGDPYTNYHGLHAVAYGRTVMMAGIRVHYGVHDTQPLVWVTAARPLPGSPFA